MKTLELFNAVVANGNGKAVISDDGYIIDGSAVWAKDKIIQFYNQKKLDGKSLNASFYKSFATVVNKTRVEIFHDQVLHYFSTYGCGFEGEMWVPEQILQIPDLKMCYKLIRGYTKEALQEKCLDLLSSGVALKEETIDTILSALHDELDYRFTGNETVRNKEAVIKIADLYGIMPKDTMEFFRYCIYRATGETLLIKNGKAIAAIKASTFNPSVLFEQHGLEKLAAIFNRFKPLFLAFKSRCPKTINKISRLSKENHKPLPVNVLNVATSVRIDSANRHWLDNATPFALFKTLQGLHSRIEGQRTFNYRVRNGKSWCETSLNNKNLGLIEDNYNTVMDFVKEKYSRNFAGVKMYFPKKVQYALPTSEKMFIGNVPTGTKFDAENLIVGIYWQNAWGARDIDLSGTSVGSKVGWNARWNDRGVVYSGDITNAEKGASEYLAIAAPQKDPMMVSANIFSGVNSADFKVILSYDKNILKENRKHVVNPNKVFFEEKVSAVTRQTIVGFLVVDWQVGHNHFVLLNFGQGEGRVSTPGGNTIDALYEQYKNPLTFNSLAVLLGAEIVDNPKDATVNLSLESLERDSFTKLFKE